MCVCVCVKERNKEIVGYCAGTRFTWFACSPSTPYVWLSQAFKSVSPPQKKKSQVFLLAKWLKEKGKKKTQLFILNCTVRKNVFFVCLKLREGCGSFLRWITFPRFVFCPAALASVIREISFPDQWSQNAVFKKKKKKVKMCPCQTNLA